MHMGLVKRIFGEETAPRMRPQKGEYLDLGELAAEGAGDGPVSSYVRVAEVHRIEDLKDLAAYVFEGNVLILDFRAITGDEISLRRITNELRRVVADINGDLAGIAEHLVIVTPSGMKVDRRKVRPAH